MFPLEPLVQEQKYKTVHMGDTTLKNVLNAVPLKLTIIPRCQSQITLLMCVAIRWL